MFAKLGNCCHDIFELALKGAFCSIFLPSLIKNYVNCFLFFSSFILRYFIFIPQKRLFRKKVAKS